MSAVTSLDTPVPRKKTVSERKRRARQVLLQDNLARALIVFLGFVLWQVGVNQKFIDPFLMGEPRGIALEAWRMIETGQLLTDVVATVQATITGFLGGSILGSLCGLALWYARRLARILDPFFIALNSLPKIALAPMIIIWFGSGIFSKIALAFIATFVVSLLTAYQGSHQIDANLVNMMRSLGATKRQIFAKLVIPATMPWIISAFRLNIGFALIAEVGGEFIASEVGLGHLIFVNGNLFNLNAVWVGVLALMIVAACLYLFVTRIEKRLFAWAKH
ncbi:MAG: ABC transporter permease [Burkholderiales bacterium]|nr:ABC transporter permease [Burkholderiales bacterium]PZN03829.1 MAG: ABC transporter permease [Pseudomonadota bacterium]